ncbi:DUF2784 domain-containing protein [soil metagenome]
MEGEKDVIYRVLADVVVVVHFAFVVFLVVGGLLALRWPTVLWFHVPSVAWGAFIVTFSITCPLTPLERTLRARAGRERYEESFIERYVEGILYPDDMLRQAQAVAAAVVIGSWVALAVRHRRRSSPPVGPRFLRQR